MANSSLKTWLREPLLHFFVLSLLIFAVDYATGGSVDQRRIITVDDNLRRELTALFEKGQGRSPSRKELDELLYRWVQNEVMYREALTLGLDKGDDMIRERIINKMRTVVFENIIVDPPSDEVLRRWFEDNRQYYDLPRRFDLVQFLLPETDGEEDAKRLAAALNAGDIPVAYRDLVKIYKDRTRENVVETFGEDFATGLAAQPPLEWRALKSNRGWHLARVDAIREAQPASFEAVRMRAEAEWQAIQQRQRAAEAIAAIREGYEVRVEPPS